MNDVISRQAAIQTIMDYGTDFGRRDIGFVVQCIKEAVELLPSAEPVPKWHKFRQEQNPETGLWELVEPLPKDGQHILITVAVEGHEPVQDDYWIDDAYCCLDSGYELITEAVAWMPMPEPWKGEK